MDFATEQRSPNYLYGIGAGILVALVAAPVHRLVVIMTYSDGYYSDWPVLLVLIGVVISLAMGTASGGESNIGMAFLSGLFTLFSFLLSEYLVMHFLLNQYILEEGLGEKALLIQPPDVVVAWMVDYFSMDILSLILGLAGVGVAFFMSLGQSTRTLSRRSPGARNRSQFVDLSMPLESPTSYDAPPVSGIKVPEGAYNLGRPVREYGPSLFVTGALALFTAIVSIILIVVMIVGEGGSLWALLIIVIPTGVLAIYQTRLFFTSRRNRIIIFDDGISIDQGGEKHRFRWDEIEKVYHDKTPYQRGIMAANYADSLRLYDRTGMGVVIEPQYKKFEMLGRTIHQAVTESQIPRAIETLKNGTPLDFGTLHITREGIRFHDKKDTLMPWAEVGRASIWRGSIRVGSRKSALSGHTVQLSKTANPYLFLTFVDKATAPKQQQ